MEQLNGISVILPSYNPGKEILSVIQDIIRQGFQDIIVVNDGSRDELSPIFDETAKIGGCIVLNHDVNKGKGAALKTAMAYFLENRPDNLGVVTIDDDGQHLPEDVRLCAEAMAESGNFVLGARDFNKPSVPMKSLVGNKLSAKLFSLWVGLEITDSQTGLRAIPRKYLRALLDVPGSRFEYETNMLIAAKKNSFDISEVSINTVYLDGNKGTHFRALKDSFEIMLQFIKYAQVSLVSFVIDLICFYVMLSFLGGYSLSGGWNVIFLSTVVARLISSAFNFIFNKDYVFKYSNKSIPKAALKYYTLCAVSMALSGNFVALFSYVFRVNLTAVVAMIKIVIDTMLFVMNYYIQRKWVFK